MFTHRATRGAHPRSYSVVFTCLFLAFFLLFAGCGGGGEEGPSRGRRGRGMRGPGGARGGPAADAVVPVVLTVARRGTMEAFLDGSATLEAERRVDVVSEATGVVVEIHVEEGDRVEKGQLLARLDYEELELAERKAASELERLSGEFARSERLVREKLLSDEDFEKMRYDRERAELDWQQRKLELDRTRIVAPIDGTITERLIRPGELRRAQETVFRLVDFASIQAPVWVPEKYLVDLRAGQAALLSAPALGERDVPGKVLRISPVVDAESGTVKVLVEPKSTKGLRPGLFVDVQLVLDQHEDVVVLSKKALVFDDEKPQVFVVDGDCVAKRSLELGYQDEERVEVTQGLEAGEQVVLVGQSALKDGSKISAEDESGAAVELVAKDGEGAQDEEGAQGEVEAAQKPQDSDGERPKGARRGGRKGQGRPGGRSGS